MNRNLIKKILICVTMMVFAASFAQAAPGDTGPQSNNPSGPQSNNRPEIVTLQNPLKVNSIGELVKSAAQVFTYLAVLFGVLMLVWTGLQFILAQGNPTKLSGLKTKLLYIIIGLAVVIGARIIIEVVINTLAATGTIDQGIINNALDASSGR